MVTTDRQATGREAAPQRSDAEVGRVEVAALWHSFRLPGRERFEVVDNCNFKLEPGQLTVMIGPSGCGKSTIAKLIAGYDMPDQGAILIDGRHVRGPDKDRLMVFQESALFPWMDTQENAVFGLRERRVLTDAARNETLSLLERVGLGRFLGKFPAALSGGMQRRLEMVRALVNEPALFILDEPFRGLDAMTRTLMQEHFAQMFEEGRRTALFITSDLDEALLLADRILVMTARPTHVALDIAVPIKRPRSHAGMLQDEQMNAIRQQVMDVLYSEAAKAFGGRRTPPASGRPSPLDQSKA